MWVEVDCLVVTLSILYFFVLDLADLADLVEFFPSSSRRFTCLSYVLSYYVHHTYVILCMYGSQSHRKEASVCERTVGAIGGLGMLGVSRCDSLANRAVDDQARRVNRSVRGAALELSRYAASQAEELFTAADELNDIRCPPLSASKLKEDLFRLKASRKPATSNATNSDYYTAKLGHIELLRCDQLLNRRARSHRNTSQRFGASRKRVSALDHTAFAMDTRSKSTGSFNVTLHDDAQLRQGSISVNMLHRSALALGQLDMLAFDTRLVETGALVKALGDPRNDSPGIPSVFRLVRLFRQVSCVNADSSVVSVSQAASVLCSTLPWLSIASIHRLLAASDPSRTGFVRYVCMLLPVVAYFSPNSSDLVAFVEMDKHGKKYASTLLLLGTLYDLHVDRDVSELRSAGVNAGSRYEEHTVDRSFSKPHVSGVRCATDPHSLLNIAEGTATRGMRLSEVLDALCCCATDRTEVDAICSLFAASLVACKGFPSKDFPSNDFPSSSISKV